MHVLILGGTTEARRLAELLHGTPGLKLTNSLAGRVTHPRLPPGDTRVGGFGGAEGLAAWLREHAVDVVVDATHPVAGTISFNAARAAVTSHVPLLALRRPRRVPVAGDRWHEVASLREAAGSLPALGRRVFLTTGRLGLDAFADLDDPWFLVRSVDAPEPPHPARMEALLGRGPFTLDGERAAAAPPHGCRRHQGQRRRGDRAETDRRARGRAARRRGPQATGSRGRARRARP